MFNIRDHVQQGLGELEQADIEAVRTRFKELPSEVKELISDEEAHYLALLNKKFDLYFNHSLEVARIAHREYDEFKDDLAAEGITKETFFRAALLHDVGKVGVPDCVLKGSFTDTYFREQFYSNLEADPDFIRAQLAKDGKNLDTMSDKDFMHLDLRDYVSLQQCFRDNPEAIDEIQRYGLDPYTESFMDAIRRHEQYSRDIISESNIPDRERVADLAGAHHQYKEHGEEGANVTKEVLRVSVVASELLHLADVHQAMIQRRRYADRSNSPVDALYFILEETKAGAFHEPVVKRWMRVMLPPAAEVSEDNWRQYEELREFIG